MTETKETSISPLYKTLEELGLTELERKLYVTSLTAGPISIAKLAERLEISRPNIYTIIRGLEKHGLATFSGGKSYKKTFQVESPSVVMERLRLKRKELGSLDGALSLEISSLLSKYNQGKGPAKVKVITGPKDFKDAYVQVFEEADTSISFFGSYKDFLKEISPELGIKRIDYRIKRKIPIRALIEKSPEGELLQSKDKKELRETRFLSETVPFITSFYLFANKAILWQPKAPVAIIVEDEYLVKMWQYMFDSLWKQSEIIKHS